MTFMQYFKNTARIKLQQKLISFWLQWTYRTAILVYMSIYVILSRDIGFIYPNFPVFLEDETLGFINLK